VFNRGFSVSGVDFKKYIVEADDAVMGYGANLWAD